MNFGNFKRIFIIGEQKTFQEISEIVVLARKANDLTVEMLTNQDKTGLALENQDIKSLEKKSDDIAFRISNEIMNGAVSSNILDNLLQCVKTADDILDSYYYVSRELTRMTNVPMNGKEEAGVLSAFEPSFVEMLKLAGEGMDLLQKLLICKDWEELIDFRKRIQSVEEKGDNLKDASFDKLYALAPNNLHYLWFFHLSELLHKFDGILDGCEDLSDLVVAIIGSISK